VGVDVKRHRMPGGIAAAGVHRDRTANSDNMLRVRGRETAYVGLLNGSISDTEARIVRPTIFLRWLHKRARTPTSALLYKVSDAARTVMEQLIPGRGISVSAPTAHKQETT